MHMPGNACSGCLANIRAEVESLWLVDLADHPHAVGGQFHHFGTGRNIQVFNGWQVRIGNHQQVPTGIGIPVEDHKCFLPPKNDQVFCIIGLRLHCAKNADSTLFLAIGQISFARVTRVASYNPFEDAEH